MQTDEISASRFWKYLLSFAAAALVLLGNFALRVPHNRPLLAPSDYQVSGSFVPNGAPATTRWLRNEEKQPAFGSSPAAGREGGNLASQLFAAPARLELFLSGYPSAQGNQLFLQTAATDEKLILQIADDPGEEWRRYSWRLPASWQGRQVRLLAENHSTAMQGWFGLTLPRGHTAADELKTSISRTLFVVSGIVWEGLMFLLPGAAAAWLLSRRFQLSEIQFVCVALLGAAAAGYLVFWFYLLGVKAGKDCAKAILLVSAVIVLYALLTRRVNRKYLRELAICALLVATVASLYTAVGFLYTHSDDPGEQAQERFVDPLPLDNMIPYFLADKLYRSQPLRPFLIEGWKSSDRPPLQAGIMLLQFPLWETANRELRYQILGTFLQSTWLAAVWLLLRSLRLDRRTVILVCFFCIFSRFFLMNTFYVWPKLLSAAFFILALVGLRFAESGSDRVTPVEAAIAGAGVALAMLSHAGVAFTMIALAMVLLASRKVPPLRSVVTGIAVLLVFLLPWRAYQKFYDPPGDRLLKMHLAGVNELDSRSFGRTFWDAYSQPQASQILQNKIENVKALFGPGPWTALQAFRAPAKTEAAERISPWAAILDWYKTGTFFYVFQTLGLLNLGFLVWLTARITSKARYATTLALVRRLLLLALLSMAVWCLLMYLPGATVIHQGSMADLILLFVALAVTLSAVTPRLMYAVLGLQMLILFPLFALMQFSVSSHTDVVWAGGLDVGMAVLVALSLAAMAALGWSEPQQGAQSGALQSP